MPIPPTLAARLAKRGILAGKNIGREPQEQQEEKPYEDQNEEEVIAENYDDQGDIDSNHKNNGGTHDLFADDKIDEEYSYKKFRGYSGCPNKTNIYHTCTKFCEEHWKNGNSEPDPKYLNKKAFMLAKYPLPIHWQEVYDPGVGRHYYWEVDSDSVSWLPPSHPRSEVSRPAAYGRQQLQKIKNKEKDINSLENLEISMEDSSEEESDYSDEEIERERSRERERDSKKRKLAEEKLRAKGRTKLKENNLDPMDPAAYSDVPRGGWSEGLSKGNEAKTGADVTAAGPLYQMRPYPNPGAVLRANAEARKYSPPPKEAQPSRPRDKSSH